MQDTEKGEEQLIEWIWILFRFAWDFALQTEQSCVKMITR